MAATNGPESPRQKMINLMYIILTAMLALNVSSDVLNGFSLVEKSLSKTSDNASVQNTALYQELEWYNEKNPEKAREWYAKGMQVKQISDSLFNFAEDLKVRIVKEADGPNGDVKNIERLDDLEAANRIMLTKGEGEGEHLYNAINSYRERVTQLIDDSMKRAIIADNLNTETPKSGLANNKNWQEAMFENMPVAAAVTILTKLQNDIRYAESEIVHTLVKNIDVGDFRVNRINAYAIPNARNIIRGGKYSAQLVLSAEDSTARPRYFVNGKELTEDAMGRYEFICGSTGDFNFEGHIEMTRGDGTTIRREFKDKYTVIEPTATVSPTLVNVLYAGIENPIEISVPGMANSQVTGAIANGNGTLTRSGNIWIAKPTDINKECIIAVTAQVEGRSQVVANKNFRVRPLPRPVPFILFKDEKGVTQRYKGGETRIAKAALLSSEGIIAALDDDFLDVKYKVLSFETTFIDSQGDAAKERSEGANFSESMKNRFNRMRRGGKFFISGVRAVGPDGIEQSLTSIEVTIN